MADIAYFLQQGWKNIWKQKLILLFSVLAVVLNLTNLLLRTGGFSGLIMALVRLVVPLVGFAIYLGMAYLAWRISLDIPTTITDVWIAIKRFFGRFVGASCLIALLASPCLLLLLIIYASQTSSEGPGLFIFELFFSLFGALVNFVPIGFFANDWDVQQSLKNAWSLFKFHFQVLAGLGLMFALISTFLSAVSAALTVLIQSGFDGDALQGLNYLSPHIQLHNNWLFLLISGAYQIFYTPFFSSAFALAYLKYDRERPSDVISSSSTGSRDGHMNKTGFLSLRCPDCGQKITEEDHLCPHCGVNLDAPLGGDQLQLLAQEYFVRAKRAYERGSSSMEALEEITASIQCNPNSAEAHNLHGLILDDLGRRAEAIRAYEEALRLDPGLSDARANLEDAREEEQDEADSQKMEDDLDEKH